MLREYQDKTIQAIRDNYLKGIRQQVVSAATGTGKTQTFSHMPERLRDLVPGQMLVLAHRSELVSQAIDKIQKANPTLKVAREMGADKADPNADIIVASVQTLGRANTKRAGRFNWDNISTVITDECHHATSQSYLNIYEMADVLRPDTHKLHVGFTATPQRSDGKALAQVFKRIVYEYPLRRAIEDGWLVDVRGIRVRTDTSLDSVKTKGGDFDESELAETVNNPERNQLIVKTWLDRAEGRQTVGFTVDIKHALDLAQMFRHHGVSAEAVWGDDPERAEKLAAHRNGEFKVLLNCAVLTEGYDDWSLGCVILARPTKSGVLYVQCVGRGTRLQEGTGNLLQWTGGPIKRDCIILDVCDVSSRHSLITLPTLFGMSSAMDLNGGSLLKTVQSIEQAAKEHPAVDFSKLQDISKMHVLIEDADLFNVVFPTEVQANSTLSWHNSPTGGFVLLLPDKDKVTICQNLLDKWELIAQIKGKKYKGERETLGEIFSAGDKLVVDTCPESLKIVRREEKWHGDPPTPGQLKLLAKLFKGRQLPLDLTKGSASKIIAQHFAGKG